jgi:hypothetical protein
VNKVYCPDCGEQVYSLNTIGSGTAMFNLEPDKVYIMETGEITHANVSHKCKEAKDRNIITGSKE